MPQQPHFHTDTALAKALKTLFEQLEQRLDLQIPIKVYLAGGMAVHLYTHTRSTTDVDAEFSRRLIIPNDILVELMLEDGKRQTLCFDTNYNPTFALMHEDYPDDAIALDMGTGHFDLHVLSPLDLAVSKLARWADNDKEDVAELVRLGLTSADAIEERANSALAGYIGGEATLRFNIRDALILARQVEARRDISRDESPCL